MAVITRFQFTQEENIFNQLAYGIRYLDFRVGAYNMTTFRQTKFADQPNEFHFDEEFWMVHDVQRNHITLRDALRQVRRFLQQTSHEVVIVDFHRFVNGFDRVTDLGAVRRRLATFIDLVVGELGPYLIPFNGDGLVPIGQLVRTGKRVLLGYAYKGDTRAMPDSELFWPAVEHLWAQTDRFAQLEQYFERTLCHTPPKVPAHRLRSTMAELTPSLEGILLRRYYGLRELAAQVNLHFDQWFRHRWWQCTNIVSPDFFLGSDIVDIAIDVNRRRFQKGDK